MQSYIGATGFTEAAQVTHALQAVPHGSTRKFMVGVLASAKSLRGMPLKPEWQGRYPKREEIAGIFPDDPRTLNLVHYAPGDEYRESMLHDLLALRDEVGPRLHGFQLNVAWPRETMLGVYREDRGQHRHMIVLQIGREAISLMDDGATAAARRVAGYGALIDAVLIDPSAGKGQPFDPGAAWNLLSAITERCPRLGVGVAGGLGSGRLADAVQLARDFPYLSIDAEGRLRCADGALDEWAVKHYLMQAYETLGRIPYALPA
ncbi:MAG: hypothetical protein AAB974_01290 [Patescibacteria group bacterium]